MAFLPFYLPRSQPLSVVIIGGGYAGIAALVSLHRYAPSASVTIVDPSPIHFKITHLHETFRRRLAEFRVPFANIAQRFGCRYLQADLDPTEERLSEWWDSKGLVVGDEFIAFDCLLVATGAGAAAFEPCEGVYQLSDFVRMEGSAMMEQLVASTAGWVTVVGGGATGIQFLFEIAHYLRARRLPFNVRLVDGEDTVLKQFAKPLGCYVQARMADLGIEYLPGTFYRAQGPGVVSLQRPGDTEAYELDSAASFLFPGKKPALTLTTNIFGQVMIGGRAMPGVFAAGDCSHYRGVGSNTLTAQAAVRKGKLAARNILRSSGRLKLMEPYLHRDMGYVISLGPDDAVGWLALEGNVVGGYPALVVKELVEAQYDLLLAGIDTYLI
jgi:NADH dehydrogenase